MGKMRCWEDIWSVNTFKKRREHLKVTAASCRCRRRRHAREPIMQLSKCLLSFVASSSVRHRRPSVRPSVLASAAAQIRRRYKEKEEREVIFAAAPGMKKKGRTNSVMMSGGGGGIVSSVAQGSNVPKMMMMRQLLRKRIERRKKKKADIAERARESGGRRVGVEEANGQTHSLGHPKVERGDYQ